MASIGILDLIEKNPPKVALTNYDICIIMSSIDFWRFTERRQRDKKTGAFDKVLNSEEFLEYVYR